MLGLVQGEYSIPSMWLVIAREFVRINCLWERAQAAVEQFLGWRQGKRKKFSSFDRKSLVVHIHCNSRCTHSPVSCPWTPESVHREVETASLHLVGSKSLCLLGLLQAFVREQDEEVGALLNWILCPLSCRRVGKRTAAGYAPHRSWVVSPLGLGRRELPIAALAWWRIGIWWAYQWRSLFRSLIGLHTSTLYGGASQHLQPYQR